MNVRRTLPTTAALALAMLHGCSGSPAPAPTPVEPAPAVVDPAALPVPIEAPPLVPLPGEQGTSPSPLIARDLLPNGLNLAVLRHQPDATRTARIALQFAAGTHTGRPGAADLAAWLFAHGADVTEGRLGLHREIERLGGTLSVELGPMSTWFTVRIDESRWQAALDALATALTAPPPSRGVLERAQRELLADRATALLADPVVLTTARMLLGDAGGSAHLASLRERDASEGVVFQSRHYRPDRAALVLEVPAAPTAIVDAARLRFTNWQAAKLAGATGAENPAHGFTAGVHWATDDRRDSTDCALVFALPDPVAREAAAVHLLLNCVTMSGLGGRLERLQIEAGLGDVVFVPRFVSCGETAALVLTTRTTPERAARLWQLADRARTSLRALPPTPSERALARSRTWLSLRRADVDSGTRLRALTLRLIAQVGEDQLLERLTDLEQPDAITGAITDAFLALPFGLVAVGGAPPADLPTVQRFEHPRDDGIADGAEADGERLIAAATPWLDQALQAIGGRDRIRQLVGLTAAATVRTEGAPDTAESYEWLFQGSLHRTRTVLGATVVTDIRGKEWVEKAGTETARLTPVEASWRLHDAERHPLTLLAAFARGQLRFRLLAMQRVDDRELVLLEAVTETFERLRIQIDRESGLVRIVESWSTSPEGMPTRTVDTWSDYRTVDAVRVPFRRATIVDDGQSRRVTDFEDVRPLARGK